MNFLDDLEGCLKFLLIAGVVIYLLIMLSIEFPIVGLILLVILGFSFISVWYDNKKEMRKRSDKQEMEEKAEKLLQKLLKEIPKIIEKNIKQISSAYRNSVTSNSFGKKNYKKFYPELLGFLEEKSPNWKKINELEGVESLDMSGAEASIIEIIEEQIEEMDKDLEYDDDMDPYEYERFCAEQFKQNDWDAEATKGSSDQGVDVIATKDGITLVGQCKKFAKPVGNSAVQEVVAGMKYYGATKGVVIAPNGFTKSAKKLAEANQIPLIHHSEIKDIKS
jgi:restriction system protein